MANRSQIISAIMTGDTSLFQSVPRLGKKNAQKIIIELRNKVGATGEMDMGNGDWGTGDGQDDVLAALQGFGFTQREAFEAVRKIGNEGKDTGERLKLALKYLGR